MKQIKKIPTPIKIFICFVIFIVLLILVYRNYAFDINEYGHSPETMRVGLLEEIPVGSSVEDVYQFMKKHHIPQSDVVELQYDQELQYSYISLIAYAEPFALFTMEWLIHFEFDENDLLKDIRFVGGYP